MVDIVPGSVNKTIDVFIPDSSSKTGAGLTGLVYNSASLVCYYRRGATGSATALTLATQTVGGTHSDGGFVEISSDDMPGMYRLDLSDAIVAAGVDYATIMLKGATNMAPTAVRINLEDKVAVTDILSDGVALNTTSGVLDEVALAQDLGTTARADVNAEVMDAIGTDVYQELEVVDISEGTASIVQMIREIHAALRQPVLGDTATEKQTIFKRDGTTELMQCSITNPTGTSTLRGRVNPYAP